MYKPFLWIFFAFLAIQCKTAKSPESTQATLLNTYWKLAEMNGNPVITPENSREAT